MKKLGPPPMNVQPGTSRERQAIPIHLPSQGKVRGSQSRLAKREAKVAREISLIKQRKLLNAASTNRSPKQ
jgi:hypothetical protein